MIVKDALPPRFVVVEREASLVDVAMQLDQADAEVAAVVDPRYSPAAIISDRDIRRAIADGRDLATTPAFEYLTHEARRVALGGDLDEAIVQMIVAGFRHIMVVEDGQVLGVIAEADILRAVMRRGVPVIRVMGRSVDVPAGAR